MLKILAIIFRDCELSLQHNPVQGSSATANGPLPVIALMVIAVLAVFFLNR